MNNVHKVHVTEFIVTMILFFVIATSLLPHFQCITQYALCTLKVCTVCNHYPLINMYHYSSEAQRHC